jgi:[ribosomal protein S5]-alanine N-acetyltransferase
MRNFERNSRHDIRSFRLRPIVNVNPGSEHDQSEWRIMTDWTLHLTIAEALLETGRLRLEPLVESHAVELFELYSDSRMYTYVPQDPPASESALKARYRFLSGRRSPDGTEGWFNWAIREKTHHKCIGSVQLTLRKDGRAQIAYEIGVPYWRQGYATEACMCVIAAAFETGISEVWAELDSRNIASIRLLGRLGFRRGAFKANADFFKGNPSDEWTYTLRSPRRSDRNCLLA